MNLKREVWEGWTVQDFIDDIETQVQMVMHGQSWVTKFTTKEELRKWLIDNQSSYKKEIPEVTEYFANKYNLK